MNMSNMKNIVVLKNLPSNLVDEAIVVLKENKNVKKYQYVDSSDNKNIDAGKKKVQETLNNSEYIIKEAENVINQYISKLEKKSPKWKYDMNKLQKRYKKSVKLNFILGFISIISIALSLI